MGSTHLTRRQAETLYVQVGIRLRWLNRLTERMHRRRFPPDDPLYVAALKARNAMQDLMTAAHYATCEHGVGRAEKGREV